MTMTATRVRTLVRVAETAIIDVNLRAKRNVVNLHKAQPHPNEYRRAIKRKATEKWRMAWQETTARATMRKKSPPTRPAAPSAAFD